MKGTIKPLINFLPHPSTVYSVEGVAPQRRQRMLNLSLEILTIFLSIIILGAICRPIALSWGEWIASTYNTINPAEQMLGYNHKIAEKWLLSVFAILIAPALEEFAFRYGLNLKPTPLALCLSSSLLYCAVGPLRLTPLSFQLSFAILILVLGFCFYWGFRRSMPQIGRYKGSIVVLFSLLFGLAHLGNLETFEWIGLPVYLLCIAPIFLFGYYLAYIRIRRGIGMAILLHLINNMVAILLMRGAS
ncbi:hypothetical protein PORCRE_910 [Porphyromonas crevioricanis JCM 15906]|uniref:CAAX prenyl protease 2/Lysostaphin resistance protein A-like domain-containing protein n=1 Tax=Porphyromonas crevioricanis JCM 15906 TaxID=1305617 RepID=T1DRE0_9PORP|nr:CPBP family glutamic-type intramembrane protease [Porphyromonas crevioricanis]GAD05210.1 hypothetical protein PORCRE_910 [Porphyromonas crevioricanis JCM 15906]